MTAKLNFHFEMIEVKQDSPKKQMKKRLTEEIDTCKKNEILEFSEAVQK